MERREPPPGMVSAALAGPLRSWSATDRVAEGNWALARTRGEARERTKPAPYLGQLFAPAFHPSFVYGFAVASLIGVQVTNALSRGATLIWATGFGTRLALCTVPGSVCAGEAVGKMGDGRVLLVSGTMALLAVLGLIICGTLACAIASPLSSSLFRPSRSRTEFGLARGILLLSRRRPGAAVGLVPSRLSREWPGPAPRRLRRGSGRPW